MWCCLFCGYNIRIYYKALTSSRISDRTPRMDWRLEETFIIVVNGKKFLIHLDQRDVKVLPLAVFRSVVATSVFALFNTFWNSVTLKRIRECI